MGNRPEIALLISTYQRPYHLERVLASVASQRGVRGQIEVVVTDDGSTDSTREVVEQFARKCEFPVSITTHPHEDFQLARCRNDGVRASSAPYLLFLDGDCLLPPDHVQQHLAKRAAGLVWGGYCYRLDQFTSQRIDVNQVLRGDFLRLAPRSEVRSLNKLSRKSQFYSFIGHPSKPRLFGGNVGISREDYERVNGYDECFVGWGGEDDDLRIRLRAAGIQIRSILPWTRTFHLWHAPVESAPQRTSEGRNIPYLTRRKRLTRCRNGLVRRTDQDLTIRLQGNSSNAIARDQLEQWTIVADQPADVELAFGSHPGIFSGQAEWNILVDDGKAPANELPLRQADFVLTDRQLPEASDAENVFALHQLGQVLRAVA